MAQRAAYNPWDEAATQAQPRNGLASGTARPRYGQSFMQSLLRRMFSGQGRPRFQRATQLPGGYKPGYSRRFAKRRIQGDAFMPAGTGGNPTPGAPPSGGYQGNPGFGPGENIARAKQERMQGMQDQLARMGNQGPGGGLAPDGPPGTMGNPTPGAPGGQIGDAASTTEEFGETGNDVMARQGQPIPRRQAQTHRKRQDVGWLFGDRMGGL